MAIGNRWSENLENQNNWLDITGIDLKKLEQEVSAIKAEKLNKPSELIIGQETRELLNQLRLESIWWLNHWNISFLDKEEVSRVVWNSPNNTSENLSFKSINIPHQTSLLERAFPQLYNFFLQAPSLWKNIFIDIPASLFGGLISVEEVVKLPFILFRDFVKFLLNPKWEIKNTVEKLEQV